MNISGLNIKQRKLLIEALEARTSKAFEGLDACKPDARFAPVAPSVVQAYHDDIAELNALYDAVRRNK